jgi:hypothetical protein
MLFVTRRYGDSPKAGFDSRAIRGVAEAVLVPQFLFNFGVDLIERLLLGIFVIRRSGFCRNFAEDLLAVYMFRNRTTTVPTPGNPPDPNAGFS